MSLSLSMSWSFAFGGCDKGIGNGAGKLVSSQRSQNLNPRLRAVEAVFVLIFTLCPFVQSKIGVLFTRYFRTSGSWSDKLVSSQWSQTLSRRLRAVAAVAILLCFIFTLHLSQFVVLLARNIQSYFLLRIPFVHF